MPPQTNEGVQTLWNFLKDFWESLEGSSCAQEPVISLAEHYSSRPPLISCNLLLPNSQRIHSSTKKNDGLCPLSFCPICLLPSLTRTQRAVQRSTDTFSEVLLPAPDTEFHFLRSSFPTSYTHLLLFGYWQLSLLFSFLYIHVRSIEMSTYDVLGPAFGTGDKYWTMQI